MSSPIYAYCEVAQNIYILCLEVCDRGLRHLSHAYQQTKIKGLMPLAHWPLHLSVSHRDRLIAITLHTLRMYKLKACSRQSDDRDLAPHILFTTLCVWD